MRAIHKGREPRSLTEHRESKRRFGEVPDGAYDDYLEKDELRAHLVTEQRGLCCYCLSRITPVGENMRIEHWHCQSRYGNRQLDYKNLLGACKGVTSNGDAHCDRSKANFDISYNPSDPSHHPKLRIKYSSTGCVESDDPIFNEELNHVLNLNVQHLRNQRKGVLRSLTDLDKMRRRTIDWGGLLLRLEAGTGHLEPYCDVAVDWLKKKLNRAHGDA